MVLLFIVIIVIVIAVYATTSKDTTPKKGSMQENRIKLELYQEVDNITTKCFDEKTTEFNSDLYFENRFLYEECCHYPEITEYMKKNLQYIGRRQIMVLNLILEDSDSSRILSELRKREENIIRNLTWVCGGGRGENCPQYIIEYRQQLYGLIRNELPCTKENTKKIVEDYNRAIQQTK